MTTLLIRKGRVLDPSTGEDRERDLWVIDGRIAPAGFTAPSAADETIDAAGLIVMPGLVDVHVHLREPGNEAAETIATGCAAALAGGFTSVVCMPNTTPALDSPAMLRSVLAKAQSSGPHLYAMGAITIGRQGRELAPLEEMAAAGAVGFTDDGSGVQDEATLRDALRRCAALRLRLAEHCEVAALCEGGVMHRGAASQRAGLPGIPSQAEAQMVERDLLLAEALRAPVHFQHISAAESVELIRRAKSRGVDVTAEVTPHHLAFTDEDAAGGPDFKMNPPLRTERDRQALIDGVAEGVLNIIATDHAPHTAEAKSKGFLKAPFGVIGLETAVAVAWTVLVATGRLTPLQLVERMSAAPARAFKLNAGTLSPGAPADITLFDPTREWTVDPAQFLSRSRNSPFAGRTLTGLPVGAVVGGKVHRHADLR